MLSTFMRRLGKTDWSIMLVVLGLLLIGLMMVYSASSRYHMQGWEDVPSATYYFRKQAVFVAIGLVGLALTWSIDYHRYRRFAIPILIVTVAILGFMALWGRWASREVIGDYIIGGSVQLTEAARLGAIIYMAIWLDSKGRRIRDLQVGLIPFAILVGGMSGLIVAQPDMATAILMAGVSFAMLFAAGADLKQFLVLVLVGGGVLVLVAYLALYRQGRFKVFMQGPLRTVQKGGYDIVLSLVGLQRGGLLGVGFGNSTMKLWFRRFAHTDYLFAIIGEEWGFFGGLVVIGLYVLWTWRGLRVAQNAADGYGRLLAVGLVTWVTLQAVVHVGVVTSSVPATGTVLPLISYGGSSLVTTLGATGILLNISRSYHRRSDLL